MADALEGRQVRPSIHVTIVWSPRARQAHSVQWTLAAGTPLGEVVRQVRGDSRFADVPNSADFGVWNRKLAATHVLQDGDRVEIYRPLRVDPKVARRERFQKQGARSAGLFAKRRPGAKAGY